jgi:hypothetical protein
MRSRRWSPVSVELPHKLVYATAQVVDGKQIPKTAGFIWRQNWELDLCVDGRDGVPDRRRGAGRPQPGAALLQGHLLTLLQHSHHQPGTSPALQYYSLTR